MHLPRKSEKKKKIPILVGMACVYACHICRYVIGERSHAYRDAWFRVIDPFATHIHYVRHHLLMLCMGTQQRFGIWPHALATIMLGSVPQRFMCHMVIPRVTTGPLSPAPAMTISRDPTNSHGNVQRCPGASLVAIHTHAAIDRSALLVCPTQYSTSCCHWH